ALYASEPVFRAVLDRCDALLAAERGASLLDVMFGRPGAAGDLDDPQWKQPAIYALECALAALWESIGIRPDVVLGHSLGEIAAAHAAGVFGLEDGLRFAAARGSLIGALPGEGAMAAIFAPPARVADAVAAQNAASDGPGLSIAADNGAHQVVSGPVTDIEVILARFEAEEVRVARLRRSPAYHSAMIEPALGDLEAAISTIAFAPPSLTFVSNLTGRAIEQGESPDAAYWRRQAREPVAFRACIETLAELGVDAVIEIGPHAVLGPMTTMAWPESAGAVPAVLSSLQRPSRDEPQPAPGSGGGFVEAVAGAYEAGLPLRFEGLFAGEERRRIALPGYPFQRERYWIEAPRRRRSDAGHPLLGARHESASGEIAFDTEVFPSDPAWLSDHRVFGRLIAPGALYGAMAASATLAEGSDAVLVEDFSMQNALVFADEDAEDDYADAGRRVQVLLDDAEDGAARRVRILSRGDGEDGWTLHAEGRVSTTPAGPAQAASSLDIEGLKAALAPVDLAAYYRAKAAVGIDLGPSFRTVNALWARPGEAIAEVALPAGLERSPFDVHPLVLDGCFQAFGAARNPDGGEEGITYLPFAWERLWLKDRLPERLVCHVQMRQSPQSEAADATSDDVPEVHAADLRLYQPDGTLIGELAGFTVKRATRAALLSAVEGIDELLYEVVWQDCALPPGMLPADFLAEPSDVAAGMDLFTDYLANEGVEADNRAALLADLEHLSHAYALATLDKLGWQREPGASVKSEDLRQRLEVGDEHVRLFRRLLEMQVRTGVLTEADGCFVVAVGSEDPLPDAMPDDAEAFAGRMAAQYDHGSNEIGLFRRSANALPDVLRGEADALTLLFSSGEPTAADLYLKAPVARAANRLLADTIAALLAELPSGRRLKVIEVGAGTGSATASVLPQFPEGGYDYVYTDISAGFFSEAESRFGGAEASIDYRVLDVEKDPVEQGFELHGYDLVIASNVLHATRYLNETLAHCLALLAPSGQLVALCRRLPPPPRAGHPHRLAAGPRRCRFRGHRHPRLRRNRPQRQSGPGRDRGARACRGGRGRGRLGAGRRPGRPRGRTGFGTRGAQSDGRAGG
ncbi:MAG: polyketide synthase dehydratase domain-containing protein, partial [Alphaproteobacteria bacterium]|nr:polyketide synthase dehydratase domain-containing protein [Alphaproteobacteria bacterium]